MSKLSRLITSHPLLAMLLLALLLLSLRQWLVPEKKLLIINEGLVQERIRVWERQTKQLSDPAQQQKIVEQLVTEQMLVQEALALGFDQLGPVQMRLEELGKQLVKDDDPNASRIRESLAEQALASDTTIHNHLINSFEHYLKSVIPVARPEPTAIEAYFNEHGEQFRIPARRSIQHIFFAPETSPERIAAVSQQLAQDPAAVPESYRLGDAFLGGYRFANATVDQLARQMGQDFAAACFKLAPELWSEPLQSPYGSHLVWIDDAVDSRMPALASVEDKIVTTLNRKRYEEKKQQKLASLRSGYRLLLPDGFTAPDGFSQ